MTAADWAVSPWNAYVEALAPHVMPFRGGVFERWLGLDEVMRVGLCDGISAL